MPSLEQKRKRQKRMRPLSFFASIALIIVAIASFNGLFDIYRKYSESKKGLVQTERELQTLENREIELTKNLERLSTPRGVEEEIREKFSVAKEGEMMALIVEAKAKQKNESVNEENWILRWFKEIQENLPF